MFASMIGAGIGGVYTVVGGEEDSIIRAHHLLHLSEPGIYILQRLRVALAITTVAP